MNLIPLVNQDDEVMVKAPDGSWKLFRAGQLEDLPAPPPPAPRAFAPPVSTPVRRPPPVAGGVAATRIPVMDIMPPHTVVGPIQELRMSLEDYLRLAPTAAGRVERIKAKIALLEKEEYAKKLEGITAWKTSEVFGLYVLLGQESVLGSVGIDETIAKRKAAGQSVLSVEDFQEITKLNKEIRN